jgi:predicted hotdog family 3-hydroxylacyl-ACP dehydratase
MPLDHAWLLAHLPHQGSMCLLDAVTDWDAQRIRCMATSHRDVDNPLRAHDRLGAACGIEYAAQAMAAHGALLAAADDAPRAGDDNTILYGFRVSAAGRELLSGRAAVVLDADILGNLT